MLSSPTSHIHIWLIEFCSEEKKEKEEAEGEKDSGEAKEKNEDQEAAKKDTKEGKEEEAKEKKETETDEVSWSCCSFQQYNQNNECSLQEGRLRILYYRHEVH